MIDRTIRELIPCSPPDGIPSLRRLTPEETGILERAGSESSCWNEVEITDATRLDLIRNCRFLGRVHVHLPGGSLRDTTLKNCIIAGPADVVRNGLLEGITVFPGSSVSYCGRVTASGVPGFAVVSIHGGVETGERDIPLLPLMDHAEASFLATSGGREKAGDLARTLKEEMADCPGIVGENSVLESIPVVQDTIVLEGCTVDCASSLRGSLLLPGAVVKDGSLVRNSVLQWNAMVDSLAVVQDSVVGECAVVERHGKLLGSFLGADSVLGEGEVTASIVGPLTGMHHQSLLIAALWPGGMGNLGYGANVGSNHTSRLPDQEIRPGTGFFFGLDTAVKFPSDFSESPFSIIATGLTTLPQKVSFPFSLITLPRERPADVPEGYHRLVPGWMLHSNLYSLLRNHWKYSGRKRSVHTGYETSVFTPSVLSEVSRALFRLENAGEGPVGGSGKNFITPEDRLAGIQAYRKCLRFFELLRSFHGGILNTGEVCELRDLVQQIHAGVHGSREKDSVRGMRIIPDYDSVRAPGKSDAFLSQFDAVVKSFLERL